MSTEAEIVPFRRQKRERRRVSRMIGRWPDGILFEDAAVGREPFFRGCDREMPGIWPQSSLSVAARIVRGR